MGRLTQVITGKAVAFDTPPLIYYIEQNPQYKGAADDLFNAIDNGAARGMTSVLTLLEVLVQPLRSGRMDLASQYRQVLENSRGIRLLPVLSATCEVSAHLRAKYDWIRTPDAIQIAVALQDNADVIVTNDDRWRRLTEIPVVILSDYL